MRQIMYISEGRPPHFDRDQRDILAVSRRNNVELGVTGILVTHRHLYLQVLEGPEDSLPTLVQFIAGDPRHSRFRLLHDVPIAATDLMEWTMGHVSTSGDRGTADLAGTIDAVHDHGAPCDTHVLLHRLVALGREVQTMM